MRYSLLLIAAVLLLAPTSAAAPNFTVPVHLLGIDVVVQAGVHNQHCGNEDIVVQVGIENEYCSSTSAL